jgi:hypothetical protein
MDLPCWLKFLSPKIDSGMAEVVIILQSYPHQVEVRESMFW